MNDAKPKASESSLMIGRNPLIEALRSGSRIQKILLAKGAKGESIEEIRRLARADKIRIIEVPHEALAKYGDRNSAQGVVAFIEAKEYLDIEELLLNINQKHQQPFILVFDEIMDPHNLGALIRTAACVGAHGGIVPKHHSASINETVNKASAGASITFPIARVPNIAAAIDLLKEKGVWVVGSDARASLSFMKYDFTVPTAIVVGNEGKGMRRLVREKCDQVVSIPMGSDFDSLNASVAGALLMYEVFRQRSGK